MNPSLRTSSSIVLLSACGFQAAKQHYYLFYLYPLLFSREFLFELPYFL